MEYRTLGCIFGTIILDLMCSFGPLFPIPEYTLAKQLLIPAGVYIAIAIVCVFLIFPQTLNHIMLDAVTTKMLGTTIKLFKLQNQVVMTPPKDTEKWHELAVQSYALRAGHTAAVTALEGQTALLQLEITRGQVGPGDLQKLFGKVKNLGLRAYGLASFSMIIDEQQQSVKNTLDDISSHSNVRSKAHLDQMEKNIDEAHSLTGLLPILAESTAELRKSSAKALDDITEWLLLVNHTRWKKKPSTAPDITQREANILAVKDALKEFREGKHFSMLDSYKDNFDPNTGELKPDSAERYRYASRDLFRCFVFTSSLIGFTIDLIELLECLIQIERENPTSRIQLPSAFTKSVVKSANEKEGGNPLAMGTDDHSSVNVNRSVEEDEQDGHDEARSETSTAVEGKEKPKKEKKVKTHAKDPDAEDPRNAFQRFGRSVHHIWQGLTGASGLFALKYGLVSVALWIPAVCHSSAYFTYTNRGLWALIMAQTGLGVFTGEQILQFVLRMSGTVFGLILGMLAWYIGSGKGSGNPYGVAAATMVLAAPCLFIRIAIPMEKSPFFLMTNVTLMFTVGYSWVDEHVYQTANQGSGAGLAGRRALLVMIGFTAAFIVMLFPHPVTARALFRRKLAKNMSDIGDLYGKVVTGIESELDHDNAETDGNNKGKIAEARRERYKGGFLKVLGRIMAMQPQLAYAGVEPGLRGPWPKKKYEALFKTQSQILSTLALLSSAYSRMDVKWCKRLATRSELMHPAFIADCLSMFSILQQALRTGEPLPPMIPIFEKLAIHRNAMKGMARHQRGRSINTNGDMIEKTGSYLDNNVTTGDRESVADGMEMVTRDAVNVLQGNMTWSSIHDEQLALFATANIALVHIAVGLNEMFRIVKNLVGEKELQGLERASERWARGELGLSDTRV
ncbi:uncharacterized protein L201_001236 [Kwoniella dendrophila CBS 6074]|uniref:ER transporter 6TM N-terminal domain-containing protein n=1 Tax=Kwoniella dendrophila CBS 6074 TaxID=1295534 RepID=A0AAX4JMV4_9TREE